MISIIIPVYNGAAKILKTLESINKQTYQDYEVIIVNDGSTDNVESICATYLKKINSNNSYLFINQKNEGAPSARNRGFLESKGEFKCLAACPSGENALRVIPEASPNVILMDIMLPGMSGIECTARLKISCRRHKFSFSLLRMIPTSFFLPLNLGLMAIC